MDYSAIRKLYLVAVNAAFVGLDRQGRIVRPVLPVGFNNVLINVNYCFHTNLISYCCHLFVNAVLLPALFY
tara:strand:+ start:319 stop:531 length:213 start_codon:yes stop_codon:yes gene_type:complete